jgi:hypothetical protein
LSLYALLCFLPDYLSSILLLYAFVLHKLCVFMLLVSCCDVHCDFGIINDVRFVSTPVCFIRRVWRYKRGNHNPYTEEEQTTQWPKAKGQKDKQRSSKHTHYTKDRVTRAPRKTGGELKCSCFIYAICIYLRILLSRTISVSYDVRVV